MTKDEIKKYRAILEEEKAKLAKEIEEHEKLVDMGGDTDGGDEESDEAEEMGNQLGISHALRTRREEIEGALLRMQNGAYGKCAKCGGEISKKVLKIVPESELCAKCKKVN